MQTYSFQGRTALGEKSVRGRRSSALQRQEGKPGPGNWLTPADELLTLVTENAPWEHTVIKYQCAKGDDNSAEVVEAPPEERIAARCKYELERPVIGWFPVSMDTVKEGHAKRAPGSFYGLEFPWNEEMLDEFGPKWMTQAFHAAGTLPNTNYITKIIRQNKIKVTGGNNAGKFLFEVRYAKQGQGLHTHLFAKVPFALSGPTQSDRFSSSVYKQPMDFMELNTYRLLESALPFATPRFYYGDISNETTNFILITERVPFAEHQGRKARMAPYEVEGPFDKCKDFNLRQPHKEYYLVMLQKQALISAKWKLGGMPPAIYSDPSADPAAYGVSPVRATGENPGACSPKLDSAIKFMSETAKAVFPDFVKDEAFKQKFKDTMMKINAYTAELNYFKNADSEYCALGHQNLNVDNAYFWRDENNVLDCGVFDFGGFASSNLPHKIWWMLNMAEFENVKENMDEYIDAFTKMYHEYGGPMLDRELCRITVLVTALQNCMIMVAALPNALKQCPTKEWTTIKDRHDPRIADNVDNKSTLRTNIHVLNVTVRVLEEMEADKVMDEWIRDVWVGKYGQVEKTENMIYDSKANTETTRW